MCFHRFSKWSEPYESKTSRATGDFGEWREITIIVQFRKCLKCSLYQLRNMGMGTLPQKVTVVSDFRGEISDADTWK